MRMVNYIFEPGAGIQQALNLKGIKERAEAFEGVLLKYLKYFSFKRSYGIL